MIGLAELRALVGVLQRFAVGGFARAPTGLRADPQTGGVHQRHHVYGVRPRPAVADQLVRERR